MPDGSWFLTRYADLVAVYRDAQAFSSDKKVEFTPKYGAGSPLLEHHTTSLVFNDPPLHTRVRKLIMGALTRRAIAEMEPGLVHAGRRPARCASKRRGGGDLVEDFASRDSGGDHRQPAGRAARRARPLARLVAGHPGRAGAQAHAGAGSAGQPQRERVHSTTCAGWWRERRQQPGDPEHDVLTRLIQGEDGRRAAERSRAAAELHLHPQRRPRDHHQPDRQCAGGAAGVAAAEGSAAAGASARVRTGTRWSPCMTLAVDEFLRFESSNQLGNRRALRAVRGRRRARCPKARW